MRSFADLAEHYEANYLKPAVYVEGRKVAGVRSLTPAKAAVGALKAYFGVRPLRGITYGDILEYRAARLKTPTRGDLARHERELKEDPRAEISVTRTIAAVNRELEKAASHAEHRAARGLDSEKPDAGRRSARQ